ncbi:inorganic diphosphatase [Candidatus Dependentiae bacterium]|nr:inorganic diphosphatase [Candidatus Dependentiae bacterium]
MNLDVMIEIPKGCRNKYEYDDKTGKMRLDRVIFSPVQYPADYGFIPETLAEDGDPLDVLVLIWEPTFPGCLVSVRPVGILNMSDEKGTDQKILCVPLADPFWNHVHALNDVPTHLLREIEYFFTIYKTLENKQTTIDGWQDEQAAINVIAQSQQRFRR